MDVDPTLYGNFIGLTSANDSTTRQNIIDIICLALLYGIYLCLFPIAVHAMVTNGLQSRARKWLLATITFFFVLITAYWIFSLVFTFLSVDRLNNTVRTCFDSQHVALCVARERVTPSYLRALVFADIPPLSDDTLLVNFIIADGVVVWRAWVLCPDQSKVILVIPVIMLAINAVIYPVKIVVRVLEVIPIDYKLWVKFHLFNIINITPQLELTQLTLSLIINIYATSIIALKAWKHRKLLMESGIGVRTPRQAMKTLALLAESGVIYILIGVTTLASIAVFMHLQRGNITYLIFLVGTHLAGLYLIVVVLLVEKNRSLDTTYCSFGTIIDVRGDRPLPAECGTLEPELMLASGGKIDSATKPPDRDADNDVTFDSAR